MHRSEERSRLDTLRRRFAAVQVELALCVEDLFELLESPSGSLPANSPNDISSGPTSMRGLRPVIDSDSCAVIWNGRVCQLGPGVPFRLFAKLAARPNCLFSYDQLIEHVWQGAPRSDETLRSEARRVRRFLRDAGMHDLADALKGRSRHYGLMLNSDS